MLSWLYISLIIAIICLPVLGPFGGIAGHRNRDRQDLVSWSFLVLSVVSLVWVGRPRSSSTTKKRAKLKKRFPGSGFCASVPQGMVRASPGASGQRNGKTLTIANTLSVCDICTSICAWPVSSCSAANSRSNQ